MQDNEKYLIDLQKKDSKIKELELVCAELEEEKTHLTMKLKNVDIIQRQDEKVKTRLSITYQKFTATQDMNDPFHSAGKKNFNEPIAEGIGEVDEDENEGYSLASQLGAEQDKGGLAGELGSLLPSDDTGAGNMFESRDYFKKKTMKDIDKIMEDEDKQAESKKKTIEAEQIVPLKDEQPLIADSVKEVPIEEPAMIPAEEPITQPEELPPKEEDKDKPEGVPVQSNEEVKKPELTSTQAGETNLEFTGNADKVMKEKFMNKMKEENKKMVAALGSTGLDIRPSKIATFDFLTLKKNPKVLKMLNARKEIMSNVIFSDYMYLIKERDLSQKTKYILYISESEIYVLLKQSYKAKRVIPLNDLKSIIVFKTSGILLALHFEKA
jgi:hypothetical protein